MTFAAWEHAGARRGFEVVSIDGLRYEGVTAAAEGAGVWAVRYAIQLDSHWRAVTADVASWSGEVRLEHDGKGHWRVDGREAPELDGCMDVDLESSALTNAFPVQRLGLPIGDQAEAPAVYVHAMDLRVDRLEQRYVRLSRSRYHYAAPRFDFECELVYDDGGLVVEYPGIATRAV